MQFFSDDATRLSKLSKDSLSVFENKKSMTDFKGPAFYDKLIKWIMSEQQLRDNGFPRKHPDGPEGRAMVYAKKSNNKNKKISYKKVPKRICGRCDKVYVVDEQGFSVRQVKNCIYHWGKRYRGRYSCCYQTKYDTGCCEAETHVWEYIDYENLYGYVETLSKDKVNVKVVIGSKDPNQFHRLAFIVFERQYCKNSLLIFFSVCKDGPVNEQGVYALDCEMCYTTQGLELIKVTIIDEDCKVIYETLVKPQNPIIDYNTRFSGVKERDMFDVTTTILDVQARILTMFSNKTILVGHSLESDFQALRLLHDTVVDTSVMFPHTNGYPHKRALKNLCSEYLRKVIQRDVDGHDSKEDAVACMELVRWKVKE